ncbi:DNA repair protein RadC [Desulfohalotomaculum tongense]|uniref:RadC family protein n=1 Tax=Desulforadius tongensis TaxID=1216062 RepID=UPI001958C63B|nr:DNA repair protein RadC [Desulforadius tongensis]MBM7854532.1 DNA repair protein RadC [Desulforadius tongensis]
MRYLTLKELPKELRPRERLLARGAAALSNIELLAILLRTGTNKTSAVDLAGRLFAEFKDLTGLMEAAVEELASIKGVGPVKAVQIKAALELGKRLAFSPAAKRVAIRSPDDAAALVMEDMRRLDREHFCALLLNTKNQVLSVETISVGTLNSSVVHPRELFKAAIKKSSAAVILLHNHPSGDPAPSREDIAITKRIVKSGEILGISVLDHLIIGDNRFISLKSEGVI